MAAFPLQGTIWKYNGPPHEQGGVGKAHRVIFVDPHENQIITSSGSDSWLGQSEVFQDHFSFLRFHE